jgi:hypothetical protein
MKNLIIPTLFLFSTGTLFAQDCSKAEDCLAQAKKSWTSEAAAPYFEKAIKLAKKESKNLSPYLLERGIKWYNEYTPNLKEAEKDFKAAIKEDEKNISPYLWLGYLYSHSEDGYKKANDYFTETLNKFPNDPRLIKERAHNHRYYNHDQLAATDFEMAYNLMMDDASMLDEETRADIARWHAELYMRGKNIIIADENAVKILEGGYKLAPDHALLLGDLALAYYDTDNVSKAYELGEKANRINKSTVGSLFIAMTAIEQQEFFLAASVMWEADRALLHPHPLVFYYFSSAQWGYCFNVAKDQWANNKAIIKDRLERAVLYGMGTKYEPYAQHAKEMLASIDN